MKSPKNATEKAEINHQKKPKGPEPENATSAKDAKKVKTKTKSMKTNNLIAIALLMATALLACRNTDKTKDEAALDSSIEQIMTDTSAINRGKTTAEFMQAAADASAMEIQIGKIAMQKATDVNVKKFAEKMVKDHTRANEQLQKIAGKKNVKLTAVIPPQQQAHFDEMSKMAGSSFDKHYMEMMVKDHVKALDLFKAASTSGDVEIRNYAAKILRTLEGHFKMATDINAGLK